MNNHILDFTAGFTGGTQAQWQALTEKALRGADFTETLVRRTEDGIVRGPLFTDAPENTGVSKSEIPHLAGRIWHTTSEVDHPDIDHANADILADLNGGVSALALRTDPTGKDGIAVRDRSDLHRLLSGVMANLVPIAVVPSAHNFETAALLAEHFQNDSQLTDIHISLGISPLENTQRLASITSWLKTNAPHWKAMSIDAARVHEAGATQAQELAAMLSQAVSVIRKLQAHNVNVDDVLSLMDIHLASEQDGHMGIIKLRATRMLWAKMAESFGAKNTNCTVHATSSRRMLSKMDPWSNMLRLSGATFGAVCGGADYITTLPFTQPLGLATPFARRISRNQQILLMEESHLGHVADPASGSYTHETLTYELAKNAWGLFQEMEKLGGWDAAQDWFKKQIKSAHQTRMAKIQSGESLLVGINQFTKPDVRKAEVLPRPKIKPKSGSEINTDNFAEAVAQIKDGHLLPLRQQDNPFKPVRLSEVVEGDA
jgi:methylmalonyl-CoA mutase